MSGTQQQDISALPAMVTMTVAQWNQVLEVLGAHPWREVNPLIVNVHRQIQDAVNAGLGPGQSQGHSHTTMERQT
jgi:hypothetical protein